MAHRVGAAVVLLALPWLAARLWRLGPAHAARRWAWGLALVALWQFASGLSNVVLGWPLLAAVAHTGGAAALVLVLTSLVRRMQIASADHRVASRAQAAAAVVSPAASSSRERASSAT
jgi:cytochrome c oxidase assembly protein subunit 15